MGCAFVRPRLEGNGVTGDALLVPGEGASGDRTRVVVCALCESPWVEGTLTATRITGRFGLEILIGPGRFDGPVPTLVEREVRDALCAAVGDVRDGVERGRRPGG